ncbi:MAG: proline--tRNA ligase [bacterium]
MALPKQSENFAEWYNKVVLDAELADYGPVRGTMVIRPYGYALWENMQKILDGMIKEAGVKNAYFPLLIPESFLNREAEHVKGFAPEVAWVTMGGDKKLEERLAIRPTSETIMYDAFSRWIVSYRDLPLLINQWANVMRWEMRTKLFLRTSEFLWQEGHTAHAKEAEADAEASRALEMYNRFLADYLAISGTPGRKSDNERFAGAVYTLSIEALMRDGKGLQCGTSHQLGQGFAKAFNVMFTDEKGERQYVWQTSWGVSTRLIGGIIMSHGDDKGLILPPQVAPYQIVVVPIYKTDEEKKMVEQKIKNIMETWPKELRVEVDNREQFTPGYKFNYWEMKGVPLRIEIGPKEVETKQVIAVSRVSGEKQKLSWAELDTALPLLLNKIQFDLLTRHQQFTADHTINNVVEKEFFEQLESGNGQVSTGWCGSHDCEVLVKEKVKGTIRNIPFDQPAKIGKCPCGKDGKVQVLWAKSY